MSQKNKIEIEVLLEALKLIRAETTWSRLSLYGEKCPPNQKKYSLGCALEIAQLKIRGQKKSRSKEMRIIRRIIYWNYLWRAGIHPITYFNRHRKTTHTEVIEVLQKAIKKLR